MDIIKNTIYLPEKPKILKDTIYENCSFKEYNFFKASITNCIFMNCNFEGCNLSKAKVTACKFINCFMQFSGMMNTSYYDCEFDSCDLWHSNLCHSIIHESKFTKCIMKALYKELDWTNNTFDEDTIITSCGGPKCEINMELIQELIDKSKRTADKYA